MPKKTQPLSRKGVDYIPRPPNMWICFRSARTKEMMEMMEQERKQAEEKNPRQADLSKQLKYEWEVMPIDQKAYWGEVAKRKAEEHKKKYPNYKYNPQRKPKDMYKASKMARKSSVRSICEEPEVEREGYYTDSQFECSDTQGTFSQYQQRRVLTRQINPIDTSSISYRVQAPFVTDYESNSQIDYPLWSTPLDLQQIQVPQLINGPLNFCMQNEILDAASYLPGMDAGPYPDFFESVYNPPNLLNPMLLHVPVTEYSQVSQGPRDIWEAGMSCGIPAINWMDCQCCEMPIELSSF